MTVCALLRIKGLCQGQVVIDIDVPAYTRTWLGFAAVQGMHYAEYQVRSERAGVLPSIADYALWLLHKASDEPTQQEVADDARS